MRPLALGLTTLFAALVTSGLALAQNAPDGIDLEAIRARSAEHAEDAAALAATVRERAEDKLYTRLGDLKGLAARTGRAPMVAVTGCVAQQEGARLLGRVPHVEGRALGPAPRGRDPRRLGARVLPVAVREHDDRPDGSNSRLAGARHGDGRVRYGPRGDV